MKQQNMRVVLASEHPRARSLLKEMVEEEAGTVVGQAENASRALALVMNLRPDIVLIDCFLPYTVGWDNVPLSRMSGLDTAQAICKEIRNTKVVIINNLDAETVAQVGSNLNSPQFLARVGEEVNIPLKFQELYRQTAPLGQPVFATIDTKLQAAPQDKSRSRSEKAMLFGGVSILVGLILSLTFLLLSAGVLLMAAGIVGILFGLADKLVTSLKAKARKRDKIFSTVAHSPSQGTVVEN